MNRDIKEQILRLVADYRSMEISLEDLERRLEILGYRLAHISMSQDKTFRDAINRLTEIRFTLLPASQLAAVEQVITDFSAVLAEVAD